MYLNSLVKQFTSRLSCDILLSLSWAILFFASSIYAFFLNYRKMAVTEISHHYRKHHLAVAFHKIWLSF